MDENKIDITSTAVEKAIDAARSFLSKLISPTVDELGLLMKDRITLWRLANQAKMLNKAKDVCLRNNINPKSISPKVLTPLLANAELEEDEYLQDKWANLLSNLVDPDQNIENNIFPYILSQISKREFQLLESELDRMMEDVVKIDDQLNVHLANRKGNFKTAYKEGEGFYDPIEGQLNAKIDEALLIQSEGNFENFELANLVRCGVLKAIQVQIGHAVNTNNKLFRSSRVDIEYVFDKYQFTELGYMFMDMCREKASRIVQNKRK